MMKIALLHPSGLVGDDLRLALSGKRQLWQELRLLTTDDEEVGTLTDLADAAAMVTRLEPGDLDHVDVAFFCGNIEESRPLIAGLSPAATAIVLSRDAAPEDGHPVVAGVNGETAHRGGPLLSPHPATVLLAHLIHPLRDFGPEHAVATLVQPVSVYGRKGLDEVFEQTRSILHFNPEPPRKVFPTQMAFNILPAASSTEHAATEYAATHLKAVLAFSAGAENVQIATSTLQSSVFHSYGVNLHIRLVDDPGPEQVREALAQHPAIDLSADPELLGMIDAAARDEVLVGSIEQDPAGGYWIWAVMDNLTRGGALNAMGILEALGAEVVH